MNPRQQALSCVALILALTAPCAVLLGQGLPRQAQRRLFR